MPRRTIDTGLPLHEQADQAWAALMDANDVHFPRVLVRDPAILVRMTERGELEPYSTESLRDELSRICQFGTMDARTGDWNERHPPRDVAVNLIERDTERYIGAPRVERVVDVPVLDRTSQLVDEPGFHPASGIYYRPAEVPGPGGVPRPLRVRMVHEVNADDLDAALELILTDLFGDFGFVDQASRAHAVALLLLPFVREYVRGPTPLHVVIAPEIGTGKTTLATAALIPGCGSVSVVPGTRNEEEWRKRITAALLGGTGAVLLDNLRTLDSPSLAGALTSGVWEDRVLGESRMAKLKVSNVWAATGNNLSLAPEQVRRSVPIFLDPGDVRPDLRDQKVAFKHPMLTEWAMANRRALIEACLTLVKHWLEGPVGYSEGGYILHRTGGPPVMPDVNMGSYLSWSEVIGGILKACDIEGFLGNRAKLAEEADDETRQTIEFFEAWYDAYPERPLLASEVLAACGFGQPLAPFVPDELAGLPDGKRQAAFAAWLRDNRQRRLGGYQLLTDVGRRKKWYVHRVTA